MATMNFSVPEDVKKQFYKVFAGKNKSAVLTQLMLQAIEGRKSVDQRKRAIDHFSPAPTCPTSVGQGDPTGED